MKSCTWNIRTAIQNHSLRQTEREGGETDSGGGGGDSGKEREKERDRKMRERGRERGGRRGGGESE